MVPAMILIMQYHLESQTETVMCSDKTGEISFEQLWPSGNKCAGLVFHRHQAEISGQLSGRLRLVITYQRQQIVAILHPDCQHAGK